MIMKTKLMILWVMIGTLLAACYDDKGNYNYEAMNDITITFNERSYSAVLGEVVKIEPQLSFTIKEDQKALKFEWSSLGKIISRDRNLEFKADTTARDYLMLRVKDTVTNIVYLAQVPLYITSPYGARGWMILSEKDGKSMLSYIREDENENEVYGSITYEYIAHPDVYNLVNNEELGTGPIKMLEHFVSNTSNSQFWIMQKGGNGCIDIDGITYHKDVAMKDMFLDNDLPANFEPINMLDMRWITFVVNQDGKIYTRKKTTDKLFNSGLFLNRPLTFEGEEIDGRNLIIAPAANMDLTVLYDRPIDKSRNRFLAVVDINEQEAGDIRHFDVEDYDRDCLPLDDLGDVEVLHCGYYRTGRWDQGYYAILKDVDGQLYSYDFLVESVDRGDPYAEVTQEELDLGGVVDGVTPVIFNVMPYDVTPYVLIAKGNVLYMYNRKTGASLEEYYTFADEIVSIDSESKDGTRVGVGLKNGHFFVMNFSRDAVNNLVPKVLYHDPEISYGSIVDTRFKVMYGFYWN